MVGRTDNGINRATLSGRVSNTPHFLPARAGKDAVLEFGLAHEGCEPVSCVCFGARAERLRTHVARGDVLLVDGHVKARMSARSEVPRFEIVVERAFKAQASEEKSGRAREGPEAG